MGGIWKSTFREIKASFGRFLAIFAIIALGVGFFAGLKVTKQAMLATVKGYLDNHVFYDYRLISTLGFGQEDVDDLLTVGDVEAVEGSVSFDVLYRLEDGSRGVVKTYSITERVNTLKLISGRMPQNASECVVDSNMFGDSAIGSTIFLSEDNEEDLLDNFTYREYTVVGIVSSPLYIQYERGNTSLGTGSLDGFVYLPEDGFDVDYYTEIYVRFARDFPLYSEEYASFLEGKSVVWEMLVRRSAQRRYQEIVDEAQGKLAEAQAELDEKKEEGEAELAEAVEELEEAERQLTDGEEALKDAWAEISDGEKTLRESQAKLADARRTIDDKNAQIVSGQEVVAINESQIRDIREIIDKSESDLRDGERQLAAGKAQYESKVDSVRQMQVMLAQAKSELATQERELQKLKDSIQESVQGDGDNGDNDDGDGGNTEDGEEGDDAIDDETASGIIQDVIPDSVYEYIDFLEGSIRKYRKSIDDMEMELIYANGELEQAARQIAASEEQIVNGWEQLADAKNQLTDGQHALSEGKLELATGQMALEQAQQEVSEGEKTITASKRDLRDAKSTLEEKEAELEEARLQIADGWMEYREAREEFDRKIQEAEEEIADARRQIEEMEEPDTYVLGRDTNIGYVCFENDSNIIEGIANVLPILFFLVAALVCVTTMNRMVEEQRTQIGVLKALGFGEAVIMAKYMIYSGTAALAGCAAGFFFGTWGFPKVIWFCYGIMYNADPIFYIFNWKWAVISVAVSLLCSVGTTWMSCRMELGQVAAALMRPKAPKAGKRVLLEYIPFLWSHLSFLRKVSLRNIFRYKKRLLMMVTGISGCTALLVTGFGVKDSIADVAARQFGEIETYDINVSFKDSADPALTARLDRLGESGMEEYICVMEKSMDLVADGGTKSVYVVAGTAGDMSPFMNLHTEDGVEIAYPAKGEAVVSDKLARDYKIRAGDVIVLRDEDMNSLTVTVAAIYENYIGNYVHISEDTWRELMGEEPERRTAYINVSDDSKVHELSAELMKIDGVANVTVSTDTMERIGNMLKSLDIIVVVVILCAAGLAFVVLYNLTNINITERVREIATIKVLGFYKRETAAYVFRENLMLTAMGMGAGLGLGYFMHRFVMGEIQVDMMNFMAYVKPVSYLYSALLTFGFAWFVNLAMGRKLEGISMTESLKSVD